VGVLTWDQTGERLYETGVDRGVLFRITDGVYDTGFAWNGLTTVTEAPTGAEASAQYADNIKYLNLMSLEEFAGTIEAFTYPDEFAECDGSAQPETGVYVGQQTRKPFGLCYRTRLGNDEEGNDFGYKLHMVWGATAAPSEKAFATINDSPEAINFSWEFWTTPVAFATDGDYADLKPASYMCVDSTKVASADLAELEDFLYGTVSTDPSLPTPDEVLAIFAGALTLATPTAPTYDSGTDIITIPAVTGVQYSVVGTGDVAAGAFGPIAANTLVKARPMAGYKFPTLVDDDWLFTFA
jgi:hypothetical protein